MRRLVERGLHVFLAFNAMLGIVEYVSDWRLIPMTSDGLEVTQDMEWRAAGLLGHPLASAATAGMYAVILAMGLGRALPSWLRGPAIALQFSSLAAFGGRTALVLTAVCLGLILLIRCRSLLRGRRFDRRSGAATLLLAMLLALGVDGFGDQRLLRPVAVAVRR